MNIIDDIVGHLLIINNLSMKLPLITGHRTVKIHKIFSKGTRFVKTCKLYHPTSYHLILLYAKYLLLVQLLYSVYDAEGHTYR